MNLTKQELVYFTKIDQYNYTCNKCNKPCKISNGIGNLKTHLATHAKAPKDKVVPGKITLQTALIANKRAHTNNEDDPKDINTVCVEKT